MADAPDKKQNTTPGAAVRRREISGPGAADFLTAPGGTDLPENELAKGTRAAQTDDVSGISTNPEGLAPHLDEPECRSERKWETDLPARDPKRSSRE